MLNKIKEKMKSDDGAVLSTEMIMLIIVAVFILLAFVRFVAVPMQDTFKSTGEVITKVDPVK